MHYPAVHTAAVAKTQTNPGIEGRWRVIYLAAGYGAAPAGGRLTVITDTDDSGGGAFATGGQKTLLDHPVGAVPLVLPMLDLRGEPGGIIQATLTDGGVGIQGGITFVYVFEGA